MELNSICGQLDSIHSPAVETISHKEVDKFYDSSILSLDEENLYESRKVAYIFLIRSRDFIKSSLAIVGINLISRLYHSTHHPVS